MVVEADFENEKFIRKVEFFFDHIPTPDQQKGPRGGSHHWDPTKQKKHYIRNLFEHYLVEKKEDRFSGNIEIEMIFAFPFSRNIPFNKRESLKGSPYPSKPGLNYLIALYLDCAVNSIFSENAIVVSLNGRKIYGIGGTHMIIKELK
jgi:Holliday junction resolvase RusA-like endonuclease